MDEASKDYYEFSFIKYNVANDGTVEYDNPKVYETNTNWNIVCKEFPFEIMGDAKDLVTIDNPLKDGVEVFVPKGRLPIKAQTIEIEFVCYSGDARRDMMKFRDFLIGKDGTGIHMGLSDEYTGIESKSVVYQKFSKDIYHRRKGTKDIVTFKVEFLFTSPIDYE